LTVIRFLFVAAELGDYDAEEHLTNYVREVKCLPQMNDARAQAIADIHKTLVYVLAFVFRLQLEAVQSSKIVLATNA
jgi:hypothetical protein